MIYYNKNHLPCIFQQPLAKIMELARLEDIHFLKFISQ